MEDGFEKGAGTVNIQETKKICFIVFIILIIILNVRLFQTTLQLRECTNNIKNTIDIHCPPPEDERGHTTQEIINCMNLFQKGNTSENPRN